MTKRSSRREFLRWSAGFSMLGASAPLAMSLTAAGSAAAGTAPDYKAIVCLFLQGGQDSNNLVLATDSDSWGRYTSARNTGSAPIALSKTAPRIPPANGAWGDIPSAWGGVVPIQPATVQAWPAGTAGGGGGGIGGGIAGARTFGLHPLLHNLALNPTSAAVDPNSLWAQKRLAVLANVGTLIQPTTKAQFLAKSVPIPQAIGSHNDQQSAWQSGAIDGAQTGWGGRLGDMLASQNATLPVFTTISADGNVVFLSGNIVNQFQVNTNGSPAIEINGRSGKLFGSNIGGATLNSIISNVGGSSMLANDYAGVVNRSVSSANALNQAFQGAGPQAIPQPPAFLEPSQGLTDQNPWTTQLFTVAQMIAAAPALGLKRQVFFCQLNQHDTHDTQNPREAMNLARLSQALVWFDQVLGSVGGVDMRANVTTFTASDFSRGFATNGTGTDHGWGGHHLIMGGAVKGGDMYGQYPTLGIDKAGFNNPDIVGNNMLPTTSVDQYGATLGRWFGVSDADLRTVFPALGNFNQPYLGFL